MPVAVLSDIHSNIEALDAVLRDAEAQGAESFLSLGDIVGYGADPSAVIARLRGLRTVSVAGNHDLVACGKMGVEDFNPVAARAALWQETQLNSDEIAYLALLPVVHIESAATLVHGSLRAPEWEYLLDEEAALAQFALQTTPVSMVGHSHLQFAARLVADGDVRFQDAKHDETLELGAEPLILNPGSVGQPRDGDPRAGYLLYDEAAATVTWRRVEYDVPSAQKKIIDAGLDRFLAERLAVGK